MSLIYRAFLGLLITLTTAPAWAHPGHVAPSDGHSHGIELLGVLALIAVLIALFRARA